MLYFSRWKSILIWLLVAASVLFALPNLFSQSQLAAFPSAVPNTPMTLGLDLQGGSYILLQVDRPSLEAARLQTLRDDVRQNLRTARIGYTGLSESGATVDVRVRDQSQIDAARTALEPLTVAVSSGVLSTTSIAEVTSAEPEPGLFRLALTEEGINYRLSTAVSQSVEVIRRRVDELGTTEPLIQRQGNDRIMVQVPGLDDPERLKALLNQTAQLSFRLVDQTMSPEEVVAGARAPAGSELLYTTDEPSFPILVQRQVMVSGENLTNAQAAFNSQTNEAIVNISFDSRGAQRFGAVTQQNVGKPFAIVLDNKVLSAPNINEPIIGGQAQISGNFTTQSANDLAVLLRAGALPATLDIIEERTVGAGLGADSIAAGETAGLIGAVLVIGFMFLAYGFLGVIANIALIVNVVMMVAILSLIGSTLTLPGIAGIVLTMGMAVDANVLIYERIREERRGGASVIQSVDAGFQKAFGTITDANVTTMIAAIVLFFLGTGPVKGFAVTFAIGIVTSAFTALTLTRWMVAYWVKRRRPKEIPRGYMKLVSDNIRIPFMAMRNYTFAITAALSILSVVGAMTIGFNYGIDFTGGTVVNVQAKGETADVGALRETVGPLLQGEVQVQEFGSPRDATIRFGSQGEDAASQQAAVAEIRQALGAEYNFQSTEVVGPTVSGELALAATIGLTISMLAIFVYIWLRSEWQLAMGATIATIHDVTMTVGFMVVTQLEFNLSSIAAILTIIGYSLNDTVVVFDRVRENLRRFKKMPLTEVLDNSINETLARTMMTAATITLALIALIFFGGEVIRSFVAPMLFGVFVGTYSSIFIAAPVLIFFGLRPAAGDKAKEATTALPVTAGAADQKRS